MTLQIQTLDGYHRSYEQSVKDPEGFWAEQAETFTWSKKWDSVLDWDFKGPNIEWFAGGKLNITENCLDRHLATRGDQTAILFEQNEADASPITYTYKQLHAEVCKCANALKARGIAKGDSCLLYTSPSPRDATLSRMPSSA